MSRLQSDIFALRSALVMAIGICAAAVSPLPAAAAGEVFTDTAPPPPQIEHPPPRRDGYVWAAGHWEWNGRSYAWVSGIWILEHRAAHWVADRWEQAGERWRYVPGHWER
jgi:hypothetical protein